MFKLKVAALAASLVIAVQAQAALVIDQDNLGQLSTGQGAFSNIAGSFRRAQVVTAGLTGQLGRIDIATAATSFSGFNILAVGNDGLATSTILGTASLTSTANGVASFTSSLVVAAGQRFALEPVNGNSNWIATESGSYAGGADNVRNTFVNDTAFRATTFDFGFRTYVDDIASTFGPLVLDQDNLERLTTGQGAFSNTDGSFRRAQVVTAGLTGLLGRIDIATAATSFSGFNILAVGNDGLATSTILGTASLTSTANGVASFTSSLVVAAGQRFALEPVNGNSNWVATESGSYAGGADNVRNTFVNDTAFRATTFDFGFRTYVAGAASVPGAVPEPGSWAMMIGGFGVVGASMRSRRRRAPAGA